ncbi:hypothetical protein CEXT_78091 [Caerostris extrusa]|uniref:Uncharacterized protein n=1 Tax=Caerostris extrusa TaxID=172846 RepID=A0AAV4XS24_CAEEX|nr:hypothetical protein CEXT_78091 [Caerostris extrusa]
MGVSKYTRDIVTQVIAKNKLIFFILCNGNYQQQYGLLEDILMRRINLGHGILHRVTRSQACDKGPLSSYSEQFKNKLAKMGSEIVGFGFQPCCGISTVRLLPVNLHRWTTVLLEDLITNGDTSSGLFLD